jgi:hypothetical protein
MSPRIGQGLMDLLLTGYQSTMTFEGHEETLETLEERVEAVTQGNDLSSESLDTLQAALEPACTFLVNRPLGVASPDVDVWDDGKIALEWYVAPRRIVNATIDRNGRLVYSALIGEETLGGAEFVAGKWPRELLRAIRLIQQ